MFLSYRKIDKNYDKRLPFFQEWKIKEVKVKSIYSGYHHKTNLKLLTQHMFKKLLKR